MTYQRFFILLVAFMGLVLVLSPKATAYECTVEDYKTLHNLSVDQHVVLAEAYSHGVDEGLGYTMMAMAWQESRAGKYLFNPRSNDYGVMGININTASTRANVKGYYNRILLAQDLMFDMFYNMQFALEELLYWRERRDGNWRMMVASYNDGNVIGPKGKEHLKSISKHVNMFMHCYH